MHKLRIVEDIHVSCNPSTIAAASDEIASFFSALFIVGDIISALAK